MPSPARPVVLSIVGRGQLRSQPAGLTCETVARPEEATGQYLLFLGAGVTPGRGALKTLVETAERDPAIAAVAPLHVGPDGTIVEAGGVVHADGSLAPVGAGEDARDPRFRFIRDVDFGSEDCLLVRRAAFPGFDPALEDGYRAADLCLALRAAGHRVVYQPAAKVTVESPGRDLEALRPAVRGPVPAGEPHRVLVLGIAMVEKENTAEDTIAAFASERHEVVQRWISLGAKPRTPLLAEATAEVVLERTPKYELLNRLLLHEGLAGFDHVVITDDDVVLPPNFLDPFLAFQDAHGFALAQPARTSTSFVDHPIVEQQCGALARETRFVEIGPVLSVARAAFGIVFPFDLASPMGWGYENVWAVQFAARGLKLGIVDAVPVDHSIRPPVANYAWHEADAERKAFLASRPSLPLEDCFRVLQVHAA